MLASQNVFTSQFIGLGKIYVKSGLTTEELFRLPPKGLHRG